MNEKEYYQSIDSKYYETFYVSEEIFNKIDKKFCISGTNKKVKYLCANGAETNHLKSLGIDAKMELDYYRIFLNAEL